jgi:hypothetical protein
MGGDAVFRLEGRMPPEVRGYERNGGHVGSERRPAWRWSRPRRRRYRNAPDFPPAFVHALLLETAFTLDRCDADRPEHD